MNVSNCNCVYMSSISVVPKDIDTDLPNILCNPQTQDELAESLVQKRYPQILEMIP